MDADRVEREAREILASEVHRKAVAQRVERLRHRQSLWDRIKRLIPFTITIKRRSDHV